MFIGRLQTLGTELRHFRLEVKLSHCTLTNVDNSSILIEQPSGTTFDWPSLVHETPVIAALLMLFEVVAHDVTSSSVTRSKPCQVDAVLVGTDNLGCTWRSRVTFRCESIRTRLPACLT